MINMKPIISVHIVTYNSGKDIMKCIDSILRQTYPISDIIVVDNASTDNTLEILAQYDVTLIKNNNNLGFAEAHNLAIESSYSDYVLVLNPDVVLQEDFVEKIIVTASKCPEVGAFTGKLILDSMEKIDSTGLVITKSRRAFDRGAGDEVSRWELSGEIFGVSGAAAIYNRKMINAISINGQFFDSHFFAYKEDVDVSWRSRIYGWKSYFVADAIAYHSRGWKVGGRRSVPLKIRKHSYINRYRMIIKNESVSNILIDIIPLIWYELISHIYILLFEPKVMLAWGQLIKDLPSLWKQRRIIVSETNRDNRKSVRKWV
jgi:GT2 family glycosyltransferase